MGDDSVHSDKCTEAKENENNRIEKIKNYLWYCEKADKELGHFMEIGDAIRKMKHQSLTRSYYHPSNTRFQFDLDPKFSEGFDKQMVDRHIISSSLHKPPSWFRRLTHKQVKTFTQLYDLIEGSPSIVTNQKVAEVVEQAGLGLTAADVEDVRRIYGLKTFNGIDFDEFIYSLASFDLSKKVIARNDEQTQEKIELSESHAVIYTVLVLFTVASSSICYDVPITDINPEVVSFFDCKMMCMDRLSNCVYQKMKKQFSNLQNFQCSPYYHSLKYFKQAMNTCNPTKSTKCKKGLSLNPYVHYMSQHKMQGSVITEEIVNGVFNVYTRNGCMITALPDAQWIPMIRTLIASISVFDPICCSYKRRGIIKKQLQMQRDMAIATIDEKNRGYKETQHTQMKFTNPRVKAVLDSPCTITKEELACFTPANYSRFLKRMRDVEARNRRRIFEVEATRNRVIKCQLEQYKFPQGTSERFMEIFELYNPTDPRKFSFDMSEAPSSRTLKIDREADPDVWK